MYKNKNINVINIRLQNDKNEKNIFDRFIKRER